MDIIELLKRQHEEVTDAFERMIAEDDPRESRALLSEISSVLRLHMAIEERLVYPAAGRAFAGDEDDEEAVIEAYEEHAVVRRCLETLEGTAPNDKRFIVRAKIVKDLFEKHVEEEENDLIPELEGKLGRDGMQRLGGQVERRMSELEVEATRGRLGQVPSRPARAATRLRAAPGARGARAATRVGAVAGAGAAGRRATSKTGRTRSTRKSPSRTKSSRAKGSSLSTDTNGAKPRRGESTSRS